MQLVYLSPVPWSSFAQRPHKFVEWFHASRKGAVLWIDPYPTRFPALSDFRKVRAKKNTENDRCPSWLEVVKATALPIEPLPASVFVNGLIWRQLLNRVDNFARRYQTTLAIGKPSALALLLLKRLNGMVSVYDVMDDFPSFYSGFSRMAMRRRDRELVAKATHVLVSSSRLMSRWASIRDDVQLVHNGLDPCVFPPAKTSALEQQKKILGYVGTIGPWFDWSLVIALAQARPSDLVRLIGPMYTPPPGKLPANIEILPACSHENALLAMQGFNVGLIPFIKNELTASVDPVKYYEYRALGLPVISTDFGEMAFRRNEDGTFLLDGAADNFGNLVQQALSYRADEKATSQFMQSNSWEARFAGIRIGR